jgi:hypothetical protein
MLLYQLEHPSFEKLSSTPLGIPHVCLSVHLLVALGLFYFLAMGNSVARMWVRLHIPTVYFVAVSEGVHRQSRTGKTMGVAFVVAVAGVMLCILTNRVTVYRSFRIHTASPTPAIYDHSSSFKVTSPCALICVSWRPLLYDLFLMLVIVSSKGVRHLNP